MKNIRLVVLTMFVYGIPILIGSVLPYAHNQWGSFTSDVFFQFIFFRKITFFSLGIIFDVFFFYLLYLVLLKEDTDIRTERVYLIATGLLKVFRWVFIELLQTNLTLSKDEQTSLRFYAVKLVFVPMIIGYVIGNTRVVLDLWPTFVWFAKFKAGSLSEYFNVALSLALMAVYYAILVIDTLIFSFGYLFEAKRLKNVVRSVEPTVLGWFVALICYQPMNVVSDTILGWYTGDFSDFGNLEVSLIAGTISVALFIIYISASISLGFKGSNLTNRGIVAKGPYRYVRHPAYVSKNLSWWIMGIPFIWSSGCIAVFSLSAWSFIYFMRALTEERHLSHDLEYIEYMKKVPYRFIPGVL